MSILLMKIPPFRNFTCGIAWLGSGIGSSVTPFAMEWLLNNAYEHHKALRGRAVVELRFTILLKLFEKCKHVLSVL